MPSLFLALALLAGFVASFAVSNLLSWNRTEPDCSARYFGLICLGFSSYALLQICILSSSQLETVATLLRYQGAVTAALFAALVPFGAAFAHRRMDAFDKVILVIYAFLFLWSLASPSGYWFASLTSIEPIAGSDRKMFQPRGTIAWTYYVSIALQYPLYLRQLFGGIHIARSGSRVDGGLWAVGMLFMVLGATHDHLVDFRVIAPPYLGEYPFPLLMMAMGVRFAVRRNLEHQQLRVLQATVVDSEARLRDLYESSADAIFIHNVSDGAILDVNRTMTQMYGYTREECRTLGVVNLSASSPKYAQARAFEHLAAAQLHGEERFLWKAKRKDGSVFPVEVLLKRTNVGGEPCILASVRDMSEREAAAAALHTSEERYRTLFESAGDAILIMSEDRFIDCNARAISTFGCQSRDQLLEHAPYEFSPETQPDGSDSREAALTRIAAALGGAPQHFSWLHRHLDGTDFFADVSLNAVEIRGRLHIQALVRDVTETMRLEERLRSAQRLEAIGHLAGGIAHDFNNLLTPILGHTELLLSEAPESDEMRDDLTQIHAAAERARMLTKQLLSFGRKAVLEVSALDLPALLHGMERLLRGMLREDIELRLQLHVTGILVKADPSQLEQVVMNLVVNARDAMPHGGLISISVGRQTLTTGASPDLQEVAPGDYAVISVADTGVGMSSDVKSRLFEPFFTTKAVGKGTGLGLATVFGIVRQHRGTMSVYSEPGKGSTFRVYLPVDIESTIEKTALRTYSLKPERAEGGTESIFVVEDDIAVREFARRSLERHGYRVTAAASPDAAIELFDTFPRAPHLVLTDVIMPGKSGRELYEFLERKCPQLKVLYMSGYSGDTISHQGVLDGGVVLLQKPFTVQELLTKVRSVLDA